MNSEKVFKVEFRCAKLIFILRLKSYMFYGIIDIAKCESALINQFLRSGTSIGANIREAFYAHGKADFIAKLQIALKECSETEYWIELVLESGYYHDQTLLGKCTELKRILISSLNTAKANQDNN